MGILQYIRIIRRWLWLLLLITFVGASITFIIRLNQSPVYRAQAIVIVGSALESPNPNSTEIRTGIDLAITYAEIVRTYGILEAVITNLNLPFSVEELNSMIETSIVSGTSLLEISVSNTDKILAAEIANEAITQMIFQSPSNLTVDQQANIDLLQAEITAQTEEIATLRAELRQLNEISNTNGIPETVSSERNILTSQINDISANIAQNLNTIASLTQRTNSVEIIQTARIPVEPVGTSILLSVVLGSIVSASLTFGALLIYEYLNNTLRNTDDFVNLLNLPVLGVIARFGNKATSDKERLLTNLESFSQVSEEYRTLRTNILYSTDEANRLFVISSASPEEGKSITAANLATSMALSGLKVLLIDADLRRPKLHEIFSLRNQVGLSTLLNAPIQNKRTSYKENNETSNLRQNINKIVQSSAIPNLFVITSGFIPSNPSELLGSVNMKALMDHLRTMKTIDIIIIDSPPVLTVSDSIVLSASLNANVILVVRANSTRQSAVIKAKERFTTVNSTIIGGVLNNTDLREESYYGNDYSYYYTPNINS